MYVDIFGQTSNVKIIAPKWVNVEGQWQRGMQGIQEHRMSLETEAAFFKQRCD